MDRKKLNKKLTKTKSELISENQKYIRSEIQEALEKERQEVWLKQHSDFAEVMQKAEALFEWSPELAESILKMPESFERQKLVYNQIKAAKLHEDKKEGETIHDKINQNMQTPYYQPTATGTAPYNKSSDFSPGGQKSAYEKMMELKSNLRL